METTARPPNGFLSALSADDYELIRAHLRTVNLPHEAVLAEPGEMLKHAYFPHSGVISLAVKLTGGAKERDKAEQVQIAMIGRDSMFGALYAAGESRALNSAVMLVAGSASMLDLDCLHAAAEQSVSLRALLARHGLAVFAQVQQTAGCNAAHPVESRLSRCLLQIHDRSGEHRLTLTQEVLARMIGARRNSVSLVANMLQQAGHISYSRGHIHINNLDGLRQTACECYAAVKMQYDKLLEPR